MAVDAVANTKEKKIEKERLRSREEKKEKGAWLSCLPAGEGVGRYCGVREKGESGRGKEKEILGFSLLFSF